MKRGKTVRFERMGGALLSGLLIVGISTAARADEDAALTHARKLLQSTILVDGHNDLPWAIRTNRQAPGDVKAYDLRKPTSGQTDFARLKAGGVGAQFWSVYIPGEAAGGFARTQLEQIDIARHQMILGYDHHRITVFEKDFQTAPRKLLLFFHGLVAIGIAAQRHDLRRPRTAGQLLAQ